MPTDRSARSGGRSSAHHGAQKSIKIGRFLVLAGIGSGSMGVVYAAYDPELDRKVAVKLLHPTLSQSPREATARARLVREAQAMARLSHPNVASIYDVGTVEGQVFIAMEYIEGKTLKEWLRQRPQTRKWPQVLDAFVQAGRGLAAAHRAGITHRDFKPENALIDEDGRVRVLDFGLARTEMPSTVDLEENELLRSADITRSDFGSLKLTRAGNLTGTPAYMSPEQLMRKPADARSDQFSFCVGLYEGLFGKRPFRGKTLASLKKNVLSGQIPDPPANVRVPNWIVRVLTRGLKVQPRARYPSMDALLDDLDRDTGRARRRLILAVTAVASLVVGGYGTRVAFGGDHEQATCTSGQEKMQGIWDAQRRHDLQQHMSGSGVSFAEETWVHLAPRIDAYSRSWVTQHDEACAATHVHQTQSEHLLDLRMTCLHDHLDELRTLADVLAEPTPAIVEHAVEAVGTLPPLRDCADTYKLLAERTAAPEAIASAVAAKRDALRQIRTQMHTGQYAEAMAQLVPLSHEVADLEFGPLRAATQLLMGRLQMHAGHDRDALRALEDAYYLAEASADDLTRARASVRLVQINRRLAAFDLAHRWEKHAQALIERSGEQTGALMIDLLNLQGSLALAEGLPEQAQQLHNRALELNIAAYGEDDPRLAGALGGIARAYRDRGDYPRALEYSNRVIDLRERSLGPNHPEVALALNSRGGVHYLQLNLNDAEADIRRALALSEQALGRDHPGLSHILNSLGALEEDLGHDEAAMQHYRRALQLIDKHLGSEHPRASMVHNNLATLLMVLEQPQQAREHYERSLAIDRSVFGDRHPNLGYAYQNLGDVDVAEGRPEAAVEHYRKALELWQQTFGDNHPLLAHPLTSLGEQALERQEYARAKELFERAVEIREQAFGPTYSDLHAPLYGLGKVAAAQKNITDAVTYLERALEVAAPETLDVQTLEQLRLDYARVLWQLPERRQQAREQAEFAAQNLTAARLQEDPLYAETQVFLKRLR